MNFILIGISFFLASVVQSTFLDELGIDLRLLLSGFFGSLLLIKKEGKNWKQNVLTAITGTSSAIYVAPFLVEIAQINSKHAGTFFGFFVGFGAIRILDFIMEKYFKKENKKDE